MSRFETPLNNGPPWPSLRCLTASRASSLKQALANNLLVAVGQDDPAEVAKIGVGFKLQPSRQPIVLMLDEVL